jgi:hypothetical protein
LKSTINEWVGMMQERRLLFMKLDTDNILNGRLLSYE